MKKMIAVTARVSLFNRFRFSPGGLIKSIQRKKMNMNPMASGRVKYEIVVLKLNKTTVINFPFLRKF